MNDVTNDKKLQALLDRAERAAYLLKRIAEGDHRALENAADASENLQLSLMEYGMDEDWMREGEDKP